MSDQEQKNTQLQTPVFTPKELRERLDTGFRKSVDTMIENILKEYVMRLDNGTQTFKYIKLWPYKGSFMSAIYTVGDFMKCDGNIGYNTIKQSQDDINKFTKLVFEELEKKHGILVQESKVQYTTPSNGWQHLRFELTLTLA